MTATSRVAKNTIYLYAKMLLTILVNIFATRILLNGLGISDYGIYSVVGGAISTLGFEYVGKFLQKNIKLYDL